MGTVLKNGSTLITGADSNPGMKITFNASAPLAQVAFAMYDYANAPIWYIGNSSNKIVTTAGDRSCGYNSNGTFAGVYGRELDLHPAGMVFSTSKTDPSYGPRVISNSGVPYAFNAAAGDIYLRTDTPSTANQRVYQCTTASVAGSTITNVVRSGSTVTVTTSAAHSTIAGMKVYIYGVDPAAYNGEWEVATAPSGTTYTFTSGTGGAYVSGGTSQDGGRWAPRL